MPALRVAGLEEIAPTGLLLMLLAAKKNVAQTLILE